MDSPWLIGLLTLLGYLIGSIPFGVVVSQLLGVADPRSAGSRNVGFTNVLRVSGKKAGVLTLVGDIGKGWFVAWVGTLLLHQESAILFVAWHRSLGISIPYSLSLKGGKAWRRDWCRTRGCPLDRACAPGNLGGSGSAVEIFIRWCARRFWSFSHHGAGVSSVLAVRGICLCGGAVDLGQAQREPDSLMECRRNLESDTRVDIIYLIRHLNMLSFELLADFAKNFPSPAAPCMRPLSPSQNASIARCMYSGSMVRPSRF